MTTTAAPAPRTIGARSRRALLPLSIATLVILHLTTTTFHWHCPIAAVTHHPCPTCGLSRATQSLLTGDWRYALASQPLVVVVAPYLAALFALELGTYVWTGELGRWTRKRPFSVTALVLAAALFVVWIVRFFGLLGGPVRVV